MVETRAQSAKTPVKSLSSGIIRTQSPKVTRSRRSIKMDAEIETSRIRSSSRIRARGLKEDKFQYYEFGGPLGTGLMILFFPCLMYYLWICSTFYNSRWVWLTVDESYIAFIQRMINHIIQGAFPHVRAWLIYWGFLLIQGGMAVTLPGVYSKGLPLSHKNNEKLTYYCNAAWSFYVSIIIALVFHVSGIFDMYTLVMEFGPLLSVSILSGFLVSFIAYFYAVATGNQHRMSGSFVYDLFMGAILNPRIGKYFDLKMFFEVRIPWFILFFISLAVGIKQYEVYGYISPQVCFVILAHYLYANACAKGEELIVTTWDMAYEKWGFMLIFWNMSGVPFTYCHCTLFLATHSPHVYQWSGAYNVFCRSFCVTNYILFISQKNRFRQQQQGVLQLRKTFPQLPWQTLKNPTYIKCSNGGTLLTSGWYRFARKIHYTVH
ncbi:hypothetical protein PCANB_001424 [Pneumocystis canis]|nr:hypothetical protein PCANB_001424 [Pneumocystis canis]